MCFLQNSSNWHKFRRLSQLQIRRSTFLFFHCQCFSQVGLNLKTDCNGGIWQSGILKSLAECQVLCVLRQCTLHDNVVFSVCARMDNAMYIMFIMWNFISGLDAWYHIRFNISWGVAVKGKSHHLIFNHLLNSKTFCAISTFHIYEVSITFLWSRAQCAPSPPLPLEIT